jgi:hypothetical protein
MDIEKTMRNGLESKALMLHPLEQKLVALRSRSRRIMLVCGWCVTVATLLGAIVALGAFDYLLQFQDRGLRILVSLSLVGIFGCTAYRFIGAALFHPSQDVDLARQVERAFPSLRDRLVSAVEFLHQSEDDPAAGSVVLRRAAIAQTTAESRKMQFADVVDPRPAKRAATALGAVCLTAAVFVAIAPSISYVAVARLANPFGNASWPRENHLAVRNAIERIARGQDFQVEAVDAQGARLPVDVRIHYRLEDADGREVEETERLRFADGAMTARRENVQRRFAYRISGGDDDFMLWQKVEVVEPPTLESVAIRLTPPAYTGWPPRTSERRIRALVGTQLQISGKAAKPLASANLCFEGGRKTPVRLAADGHAFSVESVIDKSGVYWLELTGRDGFQNSGGDDRWEIEAVPDAPPSVRIERPAGNLYVTPNAAALVRVAVKDDLAVRDVSLAFRRAETDPETSLSLYAGPTQPAANHFGETRTIDYRWMLASLGLKPGEQVTFYATASDYLPQLARSDPRRLVVVTPDEMQERVADREKIVVAELERALKIERGCREQAESLRARLAETRRVEPPDVDRLQAVEHAQRDVEELLTSPSEGVPMHLVALLADLENNGLDNSDSRRRLGTLRDELDRLGRDVLPPIGRELIALVKTSQVGREGQGRGDAAETIISLAGVGRRQDEVVASLEDQIRRLTRWNGCRRFQREISLLLHTQEEVTQQTARAGRRTLARELRDLSPGDAADLKAAAGGQLELARRLDRVLQEAKMAVAELRQTDTAAADIVAYALDEARRWAVSEQMRTAGGQIERNQIGQAAVEQKQIADSLQTILDILANRRQNEMERPLKNQPKVQADLNALADAITNLRRRQENALDESRRLRGLEESQGRLTRSQAFSIQELARLQRSLEADAARLADQLHGGETFQTALTGAADAMRKAGELLDHRQIARPTQKAQERALRQLDMVADQLDRLIEQTKKGGKTVRSDEHKTPGNARDATNLPGQKQGSPSDGSAREPDAAETRARIKKLWGALPAHVRERMQQSPSEDFPPKYELQIEEYFRRLSDDKHEKN